MSANSQITEQQRVYRLELMNNAKQYGLKRTPFDLLQHEIVKLQKQRDAIPYDNRKRAYLTFQINQKQIEQEKLVPNINWIEILNQRQ